MVAISGYHSGCCACRLGPGPVRSDWEPRLDFEMRGLAPGVAYVRFSAGCCDRGLALGYSRPGRRSRSGDEREIRGKNHVLVDCSGS